MCTCTTKILTGSAFNLTAMILSLHTISLTTIFIRLLCTTIATPLSALVPTSFLKNHVFSIHKLVIRKRPPGRYSNGMKISIMGW
jgi:hypothetical protein